MADVWIPPRMQVVTGGNKSLKISGSSVRQIVNNMEKEYPGSRAWLVDEEGEDILAGIAVIVDGETSQLGLLQKVGEDSEVHFLPALGGG